MPTDTEHAMAVFLQALAVTVWKFFGPDNPLDQRTRENFRLVLNGYLEACRDHPDTPPSCHEAVRALQAGLEHALLQVEGEASGDRPH